MRRGLSLVAAVFILLAGAAPLSALDSSLDELLSGVVRVKTFINPDARTRENLGHEREGSGVVLDSNGLVLTIGYLMVEAHTAQITTNEGQTVAANIVGYDHESGFGLLQAIGPLKVRPIELGISAEMKERDPALIASYGGARRAGAVAIVSRREFACNWEYLLEDAIFTAPPHPAWSGAALLSRDGKLVGIGSLIVPDATGQGDRVAGNMFVPIDRLQPILGDLMVSGHSNAPPTPWLGVTTNDVGGSLVVSRVVPGGPAEKAGVKRGDVIAGVDGVPSRGLIDFYRKIRALGAAGVTVPLDLDQGNGPRRIGVKSMNRRDHLRLNSTF